MRIDRSGYPFVFGALVPAVLLVLTGYALLAIPLVILAGFFLFFFRDPDRVIRAGDDLVLSPADGRVLVAGAADATIAPPGEWQQVSIFLSPMDVHVNRVPATGRVTKVEYIPGRFLPAYHHDATQNERTEIWLDARGRTVVFRQVVGMLARRIVCRVAVGQDVKAGDRFGVMKFGSRMDVFLPGDAVLRVQAGDAVRAGDTVLAELRPYAR
ncbi:MAG TPA: phosphatidylserine decarboxylase [Vicinamibacterales bacterium]|nr:phosphatidylserine decarboxylase [Vicinamibacterales bacterium]